MKVSYCANCGHDYDFNRIPNVTTIIERSTADPNIKIKHEYDVGCTNCGHYQHIIDKNYLE